MSKCWYLALALLLLASSPASQVSSFSPSPHLRTLPSCRIAASVTTHCTTTTTIHRIPHAARARSTFGLRATSKSDDDDVAPSHGGTTPRPEWACDWMPTWLITMHPALQFLVGVSFYIWHLTVLTQNSIAFPFQLIPNDRGRFQSVGLDSVAGMVSMAGLVWLRRRTRNNSVPAVPAFLSSPMEDEETPWNLPTGEVHLGSSFRAFTYLCVAYVGTGRFTSWWESLLYWSVGAGVVPMTIAMHRSLVVLFGHLTWVGIGSAILELELRPFFFPQQRRRRRQRQETTKQRRQRQQWWYTLDWKNTYWLWWTVGGYFVSAWAFNVADLVNQSVLSPAVFERAGEGVVSQLINPENNDLAASIVGYVAPCLSAPWWEEILYRGFMLPFLCLYLPFWPASLLSALIFAAHHMSATGFIPLTTLGMTWAVLYAKCGNLLVTVLIHAMWNSRVFLGSWFGL